MNKNQETPTQKTRNKWLSTKWLATLWAMFLIAFIVISGRAEYHALAMALSAIPLGYLGVNVLQKKIYADAETEQSEPEVNNECLQ